MRLALRPSRRPNPLPARHLRLFQIPQEIPCHARKVVYGSGHEVRWCAEEAETMNEDDVDRLVAATLPKMAVMTPTERTSFMARLGFHYCEGCGVDQHDWPRRCQCKNDD